MIGNTKNNFICKDRIVKKGSGELGRVMCNERSCLNKLCLNIHTYIYLYIYKKILPPNLYFETHIIKDVMQGKLFQKCKHLLYCSVLSPGGNVNTRRMSKPNMGSILHIKIKKYSGHRNLLCKLLKLSKFNAFNLLGYLTNTYASILVYKFRPERTGFNMYAE